MSINLFKEIDDFNSLFRDLNMHEQQELAEVILRKLFVMDPEVVVLGGAPRDWLHDRPAKDLDIYIRKMDSEILAMFIKRLCKALDIPADNVVDKTSTSYYVRAKDNGVVHVLDILGYRMPIQLIICDRNPFTMLYTFHGSLAQAFAFINHTKDKLSVNGTRMFELGREYKVHFTSPSHNPQYIAKVQAKYPEYHLAIKQ